MSRGPEEDALATGTSRTSDYDGFAEAYSAENETSLSNAYYERPATLALAGDVTGRRILDAACGSGPLVAALRDRGAIVTGFDKSVEMLKLARRRLGAGADLRVTELRRVLRTGGRLIASVGHPLAEYGIERLAGRRPDYFATYNKTEEWTWAARPPR